MRIRNFIHFIDFWIGKCSRLRFQNSITDPVWNTLASGNSATCAFFDLGSGTVPRI